MFHLHSFHLDSEIIELDVKLFFHQIGLLLYLGLHLLAINIITTDIVEGICRHLVLRISYIFSHLLNLLKLLEELVGNFTRLKDLVSRVRPNLLEL